jgi:ATP-dependent DNA helicase RecG
MALPAETEWVEFKEAKNNYDFDDLGKYFSALSNEANLKNQSAGWLVFGVTNKPPRQICGSNYRPHRPSLDSLKKELTQFTNNHITFEEIHEAVTPNGRVVMFQIPPALRGMPTSWKGHFYGRAGESIGPLGLPEIEQIRRQVTHEDWSAQICEGANLDDLDPGAVSFARQEFKKKYPALASEVNQWDDLTFLNKAKVCVGGRITRTTIILLGKNEVEHYLAPGIARISWVLKDASGVEQDYQHFGPPLIRAVDGVFGKVRNLTYRYLPAATLFPNEVTQYDPWVLRETLHNCIAHQDYTLAGRINVVEEPESVLFTNLGDFLPGNVEAIIRRNAPPELYRNRFLAEAMFNLNLIDTIGGGIRRMFTKQRQRNFPLPDYDLSEAGRVQVRIFGKILDEKYTRMLAARSDLDLWDVIALDKVQKQKPLTEEEFKSLKAKWLIEGRRPNLFLSAEVAAATETKAEYIKKRAFDKDHYKKMVVDYLKEFGEATRPEIETLLWGKLSDALDDDQKNNFIMNLLQEMRRKGTIEAVGGKRGKGVKWQLHKASAKGQV